MAIKPKKKVKFRQKLINKYRLVVLNEDTFEEKLSFKLTRLNVFIFGTLFSVLIIVGTIYLIAFTWAPYLIKKISKTSFKTHYHEHQTNTYSSFD